MRSMYHAMQEGRVNLAVFHRASSCCSQCEIDAHGFVWELDGTVFCPPKQARVQQCVNVGVHALNVPLDPTGSLTQAHRSLARQAFQKLPAPRRQYAP